MELKGYIYVLKMEKPSDQQVSTPAQCFLDIHQPDGSFLAQSQGLAAARMIVTMWRELYTLNYEIVAASPRTQPSVSIWQPSTPRPDQGDAS